MSSLAGDERWLPVVGYEGIYEVSDLGRVRSLDRFVVDALGRKQHHPGRVIGPKWSRRRLSVWLYRHGRAKVVPVHQAVLEAFAGPRPDGQVRRHLNDIASDNRLTNLAYGTQAENMLDMVRNGSCHTRNRTHCPSGHPYDEENTYVLPSRPTARYCRACHRQYVRRAAAS